MKNNLRVKQLEQKTLALLQRFINSPAKARLRILTQIDELTVTEPDTEIREILIGLKSLLMEAQADS